MRPFTIFHVNDLHGRDVALAKIATMMAQQHAANPTVPTLFVDAGDSQSKDDQSLAELTRGVSMHRLLALMGCRVSVLGNKCIPQWGLGVVPYYAHYMPILLSNLALPDGSAINGTQPTFLYPIAGGLLGFIGITDDEVKFVDKFGLKTYPILETIQAHALALRQQGANAVVLLSHLGFSKDMVFAEYLQNDIDLIIGGHSHTSLFVGRRIGNVLLNHAGAYGRFLGRIDLQWSSDNTLNVEKAFLLPVMSQTVPSATIIDEIRAIRAEIGLPEHF